MILDARSDAIDGRPAYDLVIVGSGPAGMTLAVELRDAGLRIAVLESGGAEFDDRAQMLNDGSVTALDTVDLTASRLRMLGGTSNHWGGHCLPLDRISFDRRPLSGLTGWPFGLDDLMPFYERAQVYCDVGAMGYALADLEGVSASDLLLDVPQIETRVIRQSPPTRFGEKYRTMLEASEAIDLWLWATVTGIEIDADGSASRLLVRNIDGADLRFDTRAIVLACGAVENARLLLMNNDRIGANFGNQGGYLGACYMDHPVGGAGFIHLETPSRARPNWQHVTTTDGIEATLVWRLSDDILRNEALNNAQFFVIPFSDDDATRQRATDAKRGLAGLKSIAKWTLGRDQRGFSLSESYCDVIQNADALAVHAYQDMRGGPRVSRVLLRYESEQRPDKASNVTLDPAARDAFGNPLPRLNWSPSIDDRDSLIRSTIKIGEITGAAGLGRVELEDHFDTRYWDASTAWHQMGTTRMSAGPSDGVVDPDGRLHGTANVFVAGSGVFPSGCRANPTLTIVALAVRQADFLRSQLVG